MNCYNFIQVYYCSLLIDVHAFRNCLSRSSGSSSLDEFQNMLKDLFSRMYEMMRVNTDFADAKVTLSLVDSSLVFSGLYNLCKFLLTFETARYLFYGLLYNRSRVCFDLEVNITQYRFSSFFS